MYMSLSAHLCNNTHHQNHTLGLAHWKQWLLFHNKSLPPGRLVECDRRTPASEMIFLVHKVK